MAQAAPVADPQAVSELADQFLTFLNSSKSCYAAVATLRQMISSCGYTYLSEAESWDGKLKKGGKYYTTRNQSTIVAFAVGGQYDPVESGFSISAAHTDSPCLKIKPVSKSAGAGFLQVGVETYGGGLWNTWFDRDLGVSGRVLVREGDKVVSKLVEIDRPLMRIPNLAIHLNRSVNDEGFKFNKEEQLLPILATEVKNTFGKPVETDLGKEHHAMLLHVLAKELGCQPEDIENFDLSLTDVQPAVLGGPEREFVYGGRLDNLMMSFVCMHALKSVTDEELSKQKQVLVAVCFDNEEIGSATQMGADTPILEDLMDRVAYGILGTENKLKFFRPVAIRKSFLFSCDMAHALHPNYKSKHESNHAPLMHLGPVIKENANHRYATTADTKFITKALARIASVPTQPFVVRNDSLCGSTIGPILASRLGLRCVDIGIPQFAMHSIREMAATSDLLYSTKLLQSFYLNFTQVDSTVIIDDRS